MLSWNSTTNGLKTTAIEKMFKENTMKKVTKWTKCFVVEVFDGTWKVKTEPMTQLQAIRLMLSERILRRFYDTNMARVVQLKNV